MPTTIQISERTLPALRRFRADVQSRATDAAIGDSVTQLIQTHFRKLPPNYHGYPTTHFWQRAAAATACELTAAGVHVHINQTGIRQRLYGGTIKPVHAKRLAIPANAQTYGHTPAEFGRLKIARVANSGNTHQAALALVPASVATNQPVNPSSVFFWLVRSVTQLPDPQVLPADSEFHAAIQSAIAHTTK